MEMEDVSLEVAEKDTAAEIAAEAAVSDPANHRPPPKHPDTPNPRKTCQPCRLRKVRCLQGDGASCANCDRLGFTCSFQAASPQGDGDNGAASSMTLPRRRVRLACSNCHSRKARCSGEMPKCKRCQSQGIECIYRPTKRSGTLANPAPGQAGDSEHESVSSEPPEKRRHVRNESNASHGDYAIANQASTHGPWSVNHDPSVLNPPHLPTYLSCGPGARCLKIWLNRITEASTSPMRLSSAAPSTTTSSMYIMCRYFHSSTGRR